MFMSRRVFLAEGLLKVRARGYWFTLGGEKGSFGYYPHLKDPQGLPLYPDTQLKGNLRMALRWLWNLNGQKEDTRDEKLDLIFNRVLVTDLVLKNPHQWRPQRWQVKPRIEIEEGKRVVKGHMLAFSELAYLDGLELQAKVYLGYFTEDEREMFLKIKDDLSEAVSLLGALGGSRSRGYGRGEFTLQWQQDMEFYYEGQEDPPSGEVLYLLHCLVNFRNKPIKPGSYQNVTTLLHISQRQLRGWLTRAYQMLFGQWPSVEDMSSLQLWDLYPTAGPFLSVPAPRSLLKTSDNRFVDTFSRRPSPEVSEENTQEAMFMTKTKPPGEGTFILLKNPPEAFVVSPQARIRNHLGDDFMSLKEGGLFVQEFLPEGTSFSTLLRFKDRGSEFSRRVWFILKTLLPRMKNCLFRAEALTFEPPQSEDQWAVLYEPVPFKEGFLDTEELPWMVDESSPAPKAYRPGGPFCKIQSVFEYNEALKRPRRPKIVVAPGSVVKADLAPDATLSRWWFDKEIKAPERGPERPTLERPSEEVSPEITRMADNLRDLTRSQIGILRGLLEPYGDPEVLKRELQDRIDKYAKKGKKEMETLYEKLLKLLRSDPSGQRMREFIEALIEELRFRKWQG